MNTKNKWIFARRLNQQVVDDGLKSWAMHDTCPFNYTQLYSQYRFTFFTENPVTRARTPREILQLDGRDVYTQSIEIQVDPMSSKELKVDLM